MTGLLLQLWRLTFLPRRGRCIVSLSCDRAVTFCYPDKRQLTRLGCKKAPSLPDRCCACLAHGIRAGRGPASPRLSGALQTLPGAGAVACSAGKPVLKLVAAPFRDHGSQYAVIQPGLKGSLLGRVVCRQSVHQRGKNQCY